MDDKQMNFLFHNLGGRFEETGSRSGTAFNDDGRTEAGIGVDVGDVDGDGSFDVFVTNLDLETNTLYLRRGGSSAFRDRTKAAKLAMVSPVTLFTISCRRLPSAIFAATRAIG